MGVSPPGRSVIEWWSQTRILRPAHDPQAPASSVETDGGWTVSDTDFVTYTDERYSLAYPREWTIERDFDGGATFEAPQSSVGAVVFVEESERTPEASATAFLAALTADEHVHALSLLERRDVRLQTGQTGQVLQCAYDSDSCERWRLSYLFVRDGETSYTLGIDWNDTVEFEACAAAMVESFALEAP